MDYKSEESTIRVGICVWKYPKGTAMLAEILLIMAKHKTSNKKSSTLRELILACVFIAIKLENRDIVRNRLFLDTISSPVQRSNILREELSMLQSVN